MRTLGPHSSEEPPPDWPPVLRPASSSGGASLSDPSYLLLGSRAAAPRRALCKAAPLALLAALALSLAFLLLLRPSLFRGLRRASEGGAEHFEGQPSAPAVTRADEERRAKPPNKSPFQCVADGTGGWRCKLRAQEKKVKLPDAPWRCIPDGKGGWRCRLLAKAHHKERDVHYKKQDLAHDDWSPEFGHGKQAHDRHQHGGSGKGAAHRGGEDNQKKHAHHKEDGGHAHDIDAQKKHAHHNGQKAEHAHDKQKKHAHHSGQKEHGNHEEHKDRGHHAEGKKHTHQEEREEDSEEKEEPSHEGPPSDHPQTLMKHKVLGDDREDGGGGDDGAESGASGEPEGEQAQTDGAPQNPWQAALHTASGAWGGFVWGAKGVLHIPTDTTTTTVTTTVTSTDSTTITSTVTVTATVTSTETSTRTTSVTTTATRTTTTSTTTTSTTKLATLFCFEVMRTSGFEPDLVKGQWQNKASIFACEEYSLFSHGGVVKVGSITTSEILASAINKGNLSRKGTTTNSWLNTRLFQEAWKLVLKDDKWWNHAWTVKVDPDAVFFPHRLREKLSPFYPAGITDGPALFVGNCDRSWNGQPTSLKLFGALEVFSRNAMGMYKAWSHRCIKELEWEGWGEDFFMQRCLVLLKVKMLDGVDFMADNRCYGAPCGDTSKVAFHAYKDTQKYFDCWGESRAAEGLVTTS